MTDRERTEKLPINEHKHANEERPRQEGLRHVSEAVDRLVSTYPPEVQDEIVKRRS